MAKNNKIKSNSRLMSDAINKTLIPKLRKKEFIDNLVHQFNNSDAVVIEYNLGIARPVGFVKGEK